MAVNLISVQNNIQYSGPAGINKYNPLKPPQLNSQDGSDYTSFTSNRVTLLKSVFPTTLTLTAPSWSTIIGNESGKKPPLVVVSSARSAWIKAGLQAADKLALQTNTFNGINDLNAIVGNANEPSPPIYCPKRLGSNKSKRSVYIIVHFKEYQTYKSALQLWTDITVIGWEFKALSPVFETLTGFGASRYAAIEFCKNLRTQAQVMSGTAPWDFAWVFDDNVIGFCSGTSKKGGPVGPGFQNDLSEVENELTKATPAVCAGFSALSQAMPRSTNRLWGIDQKAASPPVLPASNPPGIIQQAVLWNIAELDAKKLNFSPIFVASKEDVSLTYYLDATLVSYLWYETIYIVKEIPTVIDSSSGATVIKLSKAAYQTRFAYAEGNTPVQYQVKSEPLQTTSLRNYINTEVLPVGKITAKEPQTTSLQETATCQAMEQIITQAIQGSFGQNGKSNQPNASYIDSKTLQDVFEIGSQPITTQDNP